MRTRSVLEDLPEHLLNIDGDQDIDAEFLKHLTEPNLDKADDIDAELIKHVTKPDFDADDDIDDEFLKHLTDPKLDKEDDDDEFHKHLTKTTQTVQGGKAPVFETSFSSRSTKEEIVKQIDQTENEDHKKTIVDPLKPKYPSKLNIDSKPQTKKGIHNILENTTFPSRSSARSSSSCSSYWSSSSTPSSSILYPAEKDEIKKDGTKDGTKKDGTKMDGTKVGRLSKYFPYFLL